MVLQGQDVVGVGQFALLCSRKSLSVTQWSVAVRVLKWRIVLSVTHPGEGQAQQRTHQHVCMKEREGNTCVTLQQCISHLMQHFFCDASHCSEYFRDPDLASDVCNRRFWRGRSLLQWGEEWGRRIAAMLCLDLLRWNTGAFPQCTAPWSPDLQRKLVPKRERGLEKWSEQEKVWCVNKKNSRSKQKKMFPGGLLFRVMRRWALREPGG